MQVLTTGSEHAMLLNMIELNRESLIECVQGLTEEEARLRLVPSLTTPLGLLLHAAGVERSWYQRRVAELPDTEWDGYAYGDDASFIPGETDTVQSATDSLRAAALRSRQIVEPLDLDHTIEHDRYGTLSLRWIHLHMVRELARHAGHADILREQIEAARTSPGSVE